MLQGGVSHCSVMLRAGIRDGDGMKKSGSKHHTKAAPQACRGGAEEAVAYLILWMSQMSQLPHEQEDLILTLNILIIYFLFLNL